MSKAISVERLHEAIEKLLVSHSLFRFDAKIVADRLIETELHGRASHGVNLLPRLITAIKDGNIDPRAKILAVQDAPAFAVLDAGRSVGMLAATKAALLASEKALVTGIAAVGVRNSQTLGAAEVYVRLMASMNVIGLCYSSTGGANVTVPGSNAGAVGNAAVAYAVPLSGTHPLVFDSGCGVESWGKLKLLKSLGLPIPEGVLFDEQLNPTEDLDSARSMLPAGQALGFGISMFASILAGPLVSGWLPIHKTRDVDAEDSQHFFIAIDAAKFTKVQQFEDEIKNALNKIRSLRPVDPEHPVRIPGDRGAENAARTKQSGIELAAECEDYLREQLALKKIQIDW